MSEDTYTLPRDRAESQRLEDQGRWIESSLDYVIHPDLAAALPDSPTIADIATGTGDFLVRLSKQYPAKASFHGFDLSPDQFRSSSDLPANVHMHVQDVRKPFPTEFHGKFDLVHLRLLILGMDQDDWAVAVRNVAQLVRPGGGIQWLEPDFSTLRHIRGGPSGSTSRNLRFALEVFSNADINPRMQYDYRTLAVAFNAAGLRDVAQDIVATDRVAANRKVTTYTSLLAVISWVRRGQGNGILDLYQGRSVDEVERRAREDVEHGAYTRYDMCCTIGRKP